MKNKVVIGLIIVGIIFLGSVTYALFNENLLLNDVASDIQTNDTTQSNNQLNIQNNQSNNIISGENSNFVPNNMANVVLNSISDNSVVNDDVGQKVVKEIRRVTANDRVYVFYDDSSIISINDAMTSQFKNVLIPVYDTDTVGGYVMCADCGNYIPVGDVSSLVPEKYLCKCPDEHPKSVKDVPFVYTEESVLEKIKLDENSDKMPNDNSNVDYAELDDGDTNSSSTPERVYFDENTFRESDFDSDFVPEFSPNDYNPFHPPAYQGMELYPEPKPMFFFNPDYLDE